jgi:hypothetical protein
MFACRAVVVAEAKKYMPKPEAKSISPQKGNKEAFMAGLKLENVKDEPPDEKEMAVLSKWAEQHCDESVRDIIEGATSEKVVVEADKLDYIGPATETLGPLQTKSGISGTWNEEGRFNLFSTATGDEIYITDDADRPLMVWMHDECIYRHKDVGRYGWSFKKMASQRYKDDGSGAFFCCRPCCLSSFVQLFPS